MLSYLVLVLTLLVHAAPHVSSSVVSKGVRLGGSASKSPPPTLVVQGGSCTIPDGCPF